MSEDRITVAELLARNGGAGDASAPAVGRRRHRGGENTISVAELTGEIPVVRDRQPTATNGVDDLSPAAPAVSDFSAPAPSVPGNSAGESGVGEEVSPTAAQAAAARIRYQSAAPQRPQASESVEADDAPSAEQSSASGPSDELPQSPEAEPDEPATTSASLAQAVADTGKFQAIDPGNVDERPLDPRPRVAPPAPPTVTTVHTAEGRDQGNQAWSQWGPAPAQAMATADFNTAQVRERQARLSAQAAAAAQAAPTDQRAPATRQQPAPDTAAVPLGDIAAKDSAAADAATKDAKDDFFTQTDAELEASAQAQAAADKDAKKADKAKRVGKKAKNVSPGAPVAEAQAPADDAADAADDTEAGEQSRKGWALLAGEVLLGLAAGAALFYGFYQLWNWGGGTLTIALTVALAFVVIIAIVTFTHYLRKSTDYLTLGLALLVGLIITFGPLLISLTQQS